MDIEKALSLQDQGRPSVIKWYCEQAMDIHGKESECIWVCFKRRQRWIAQDVRLTEQPLGVYELRKLCGWWKRHSLFSAVGVREVKIRFLNLNTTTHEVEVVLKDFGHSSIEADLDREIAKALSHSRPGPTINNNQIANQQYHPFECEIDIMGVRHPAAAAAAEDDHYSPLCKFNSRTIQRLDDLCRLREESRWLPAMLEFYWRNGVGGRGMKFLEGTEFIWKYRDLQHDTYEDAANPYGKTINAFQVLEGWRITYLLLLVCASLALSIVVVAVATAASGDLADGLTAGSFALGIATVALAALSLLSAVL